MSESAPLKSLADQVRTKLPSLLEPELERFLDEHGHETFYSFALLFDAPTPAVVLSANTEECFAPTLAKYQQNEHWGYVYRCEEGAQGLRYNPADWGYHAFGYVELFDLGDDGDSDALWSGSWEQDTIEAMSEVLVRFRKTTPFERMQKAPGFVSFAIGEEPDFLGAMTRMHRVSLGFEHERHAASERSPSQESR